MVLPAVLRDPPLDSEQAHGCHCVIFVHRGAGFHPLARYFACALGSLSPAVQAILLAVGDRLHWPRMARLETARGHLRHPFARVYGLLLRVLLNHHAAARHFRENQAAAEFDIGVGPGRESVSGGNAMTMKRTILVLALLSVITGLTLPAIAEEQEAPPRLKWSFAGSFGKYDPAQLQRGFKIYREVCANCHSIEMLAFHNLADPGGPGFSEAQAAAVAAEYKIKDLDDRGNPTERPGRLADTFPPPFPNELAAKAANGGTAPPDMSTLAKARTYQRGFPWFVFDAFTQYQEQGP